LLIDRMGQSAPDFPPFQDRMLQIHADVLKGRPLKGENSSAGVFSEPGKHLGLDVVLEEVDGAFFELQDADDRVGDDSDRDRFEGRTPFLIERVCFERDAVAG
jgi:hypothetical protein